MQGQIYPVSGNPQLSYQRPSAWLPLPIIEQEEEKFVGLFAVYNTQSNFIALQFEGDYTVDWGDGTTQDFASGAIAEHSYVYGDINPQTITSRGYRQVVVTVIPQTGANLTAMDIDIRHTNVFAISDVSTNWLDIAVNMPFCESMFISYNNYLGSLEIAKVMDTGSYTDLSYLFYRCYSLKRAVIEKADSAEDISSIFSDCWSLFYVELPDLPSLAIASDPFQSCYSLKDVVVGDISSLGDFSYFFYDCGGLVSATVKKIAGSGYDAFAYCYSLQSVNLQDPSELTDGQEMFYECYSLEKFYLPPSPLVTDISYIFTYCYSLREAKFDNLDSLTYVYEAFYECYSLEEVSLPEMPLIDDISYMFYYCYSLQSVQLPSIPLCDYLGSLFESCCGLISVEVPEAMSNADLDSVLWGCYSLESVTVKGQPGYCGGAFFECGSLRSVVFDDCSSVYGTTNMFDACFRLSSLRVPNLAYSVDLTNCSLSRDALVQVFEDLGTVTGETLTVTGNWGVVDLTSPDLQIASDKGWLVAT